MSTLARIFFRWLFKSMADVYSTAQKVPVWPNETSIQISSTYTVHVLMHAYHSWYAWLVGNFSRLFCLAGPSAIVSPPILICVPTYLPSSQSASVWHFIISFSPPSSCSHEDMSPYLRISLFSLPPKISPMLVHFSACKIILSSRFFTFFLSKKTLGTWDMYKQACLTA